MTTNTIDNNNDNRRRHVIITDLDQSDSAPAATTAATESHGAAEAQHRKTHKRRQTGKILHTISGNFNRRSRSAECNVELQRSAGEQEKSASGGAAAAKSSAKVQTHFNELLQAKDKQMETLLQRLTTLHKFNEQFAEENQKLRNDVRTLDQRIDVLHKQLQDCPECRQLSQQLAKMESENKTLTNDITMMKTLVYRLNVQIESYQDQLRLNNEATKCETQQQQQLQRNQSPGKSNLSQWQPENSLHTHTLSPLLQSYDEMIRDKEQLIQQYRQEFEHFTGELKRVLEENNRLLQQNEMLKRDVGGWREERVRLQAQLDVCRTKAEAQTRKSDLAKEKLVEVMHCYEQKTQTLLLDMEHLQAAYTRCKSELAGLKSFTALPQDSIVQSLQECKELLEQLKQQHSKEKQKLEHTISELTERNVNHDTSTQKLKYENSTLTKALEDEHANAEELRRRTASLQRTTEKVKRSRDRLKARLRIALQWAQKLEEGQANIQTTWDALKRLEAIVKHKESQVRGLHARHLQEIDKMQKKLIQKEETIRTILKGKLGSAAQ